jgi:thiamine transport system substrate-binding protein
MSRRNASVSLSISVMILALVIAGCGGPSATPPATGAPVQLPTSTAAAASQATSPTAKPAHTLALPAVGGQTSPLTSPLNSPVEAATAVPPTGRTLTVMTHDSFSASKEVIARFEAQCGCKVTFLKSGDAGLALNKAILSKGNPLADVFYGVDNTFLSRALAADIFEPYASPALQQIPDQFKLDPSNRELPVDYGYVNLNYDKKYFSDHNLPLPKQLRDLADPRYKGLLAVPNPATSSPGLAFLLTTIATFGESGSYPYLNFWKDLRANDVLVVDGWESAYNEKFSAGPGKGDRPLVLSYATSPAAEVYYASPQPADSPTGNILPPGESFQQVEFVGILKGARNPDLAREWVDFMLGPTFQADIPLQMWVYPVRTGTPLPDVFTKFAQEPSQPAHLTPEQIGAGRDKWIQAWTDTVLH